MIRKILVCFYAALLAGSATADTEESTFDDLNTGENNLSFEEYVDEGADTSTSFNPQICNQYNRYGGNSRFQCSRDNRCRWTGNTCVSNQQQPSYRCDNIRNYNQCRSAGCAWNNQRGCYSGQSPQRCESIRNYAQCNRAGCNWNNNYGCFSNRPGPGPGPRQLWQCTARDSGWEEHWSGHTAQGNTQMAARQAALRLCQRPTGTHDRCVISNCQRVR